MGFLSNLFIYEKNKNIIFIFLSLICLALSFYNFESRLTILTNSITLLILLFWMLLSKIRCDYLLLLIIIGYYSCIVFVKITCGIISFDSMFLIQFASLTPYMTDSVWLLFSLTTWVTNPITFGIELLNNFYTLNKYDLFLNNPYTSGDSYVTVTALRNGKYAAWHGGFITYPHNFCFYVRGPRFNFSSFIIYFLKE